MVLAAALLAQLLAPSCNSGHPPKMDSGYCIKCFHNLNLLNLFSWLLRCECFKAASH